MNHTDPETARLHDVILEREAEIATLRDLLGKENQRANAAIDREETAEQAALEARQELDEARAASAVVSPPTDRAAVLLDAAAECDKAGGAYAERGANDAAGAAFALMETFLRKAGEAEYAATPCTAPNVCEDGGDPCEAHERILGHIEGYRDLCAPDCGQEWQRRLAVEAHDTGTQQPETVALSTPCANCPHGRNWHDKGSGECLVPAPLMATCGCRAFTAPVAQQPAAEVVPCLRPEPHPPHSHSGLRKGIAVHGRCPGGEQEAAAADGEETRPERVRHSGPDTKFCVLCISGEHERIDITP